jgi:ribosomal-protein-alanine N-acetyltransferase
MITSMTTTITLRHPTLADQRAFLAAVRNSRALHQPWVSPPATPAQYRAWVERMTQPANCALLVCQRGNDNIIGVFNISNIIRGAFHSAYLGYYAFAGFERQGLMRAGLQAVLRHAFKKLKLHRLEANIQPDNTPSIALVKACGFSQEGYSPRYLKIDGQWKDHARWAILSS